MAWSEPVRVLVCDDHPLTARMLETIVEVDPDLALVASVDDPATAVAVAAMDPPDVVVMDLDFDGSAMTGIDATAELSRRVPATRVLIVSAHLSEESLIRGIEAGAAGFARKTDSVESVTSAIKSVGSGGAVIDVDALRRAIPADASRREERARLDSLTAREREVLALLAQGASTAEIARRLVVSPHTATTRVRNLLAKLGVSSRLAAVVFARRAGVLP